MGDSIYIVQVIERDQPKQVPFEQAKPYIETSLKERKHDDALRQLQEQLTKKANLIIYDSAIQSCYAQNAPAEGATPAPQPSR